MKITHYCGMKTKNLAIFDKFKVFQETLANSGPKTFLPWRETVLSWFPRDICVCRKPFSNAPNQVIQTCLDGFGLLPDRPRPSCSDPNTSGWFQLSGHNRMALGNRLVIHMWRECIVITLDIFSLGHNEFLFLWVKWWRCFYITIDLGAHPRKLVSPNVVRYFSGE